MTGINTPNNIVFNPGEGDYSPIRQKIREINISTESTERVLRADHSAVINKALEIEENAVKGIENADKVDLNAIDTAENIRIAAENILKFGV